MEKIHFEQAKLWLEAANFVSRTGTEDKTKYAVAVSMIVHSIIKANDALTYKFMNITARRHDDARRLFGDLVKNNFIKSQFANYGDIIQEAINNKAKAEYRGSFFSKKDFEDIQRKAEKFIKMASELV